MRRQSEVGGLIFSSSQDVLSLGQTLAHSAHARTDMDMLGVPRLSLGTESIEHRAPSYISLRLSPSLDRDRIVYLAGFRRQTAVFELVNSCSTAAAGGSHTAARATQPAFQSLSCLPLGSVVVWSFISRDNTLLTAPNDLSASMPARAALLLSMPNTGCWLVNVDL